MEFNLKRSPKTRAECLSFFDDCEQQVLRKACLIGGDVNSATENESPNEAESFNFAVTSTPNPTKANLTRKRSDLLNQEDLVNLKNTENLDSNPISCSKFLALIEIKRKEEARAKHNASIIAREEKLLQERAAHQAKLQAILQAKTLKLQEEQLRLLKEDEALAAERKERQELQQQRHAERVSMRNEQIKAAELQKKEVVERRKIIAERLKCAEEVQRHFTQFSEIYKKIHHEFKANQSLSSVVTEIKPLNVSMQALIQRLKAMDVNQNDVEAAKNICIKIYTVYANVLEEVVKFKKQMEEEAAMKHQELNQALPPTPQSHPIGSVSSENGKDSSSVNNLLDCADRASLLWYQELKTLRENNERLFEPLVKNDNLKKYRFDCQKAVNIPVNAISPVNASHMQDKLQKLTLLLSGQPVSIGEGTRVSAAQHPAGIAFCKDLLAKKFVKQGASTVSSNPEAAFAIAAVIVALWQEFPDWGQLLLAHFHQECPYLVPVFWPQLEGQSNRDYYMSLGYVYNEEGEVEKQDKFLKRMSGIMRLYAAMLISRPPRDRQNRPHPHDLGQGWRWLACLLNLEPRPDICASLLYNFLEVTGSSMMEHYGRQYHKLLLVICKGYYPCLQRKAVSSSGPIVRLETFLQNILKQGGSKPPQGMLPMNFW